MKNLFTELRRRSVFRVAGVYAVVGWALAQAASLLESSLGFPAWFDGVVVGFLLLGFPVALLLAWALELSPEGLKATAPLAEGDSAASRGGRALDYAILAGLVLIGAFIIVDRVFPGLVLSTKGPDVSAQDVAVADKAPRAKGAETSIAVLPFEDFSPGADQGYFADGIAEELLNVLARIEGLRVASRTSAFAFKDRKAAISEIAQALGVGHVLEGSVRKAGGTLRITAQLIDTSTDEHLWSQTYDRPLSAENIFAIQDEIAQAIVAELRGKMALEAPAQHDKTASTEAYDAYLRGRALIAQRTDKSIKAGLDEMKNAIALDPDYAPAHAGLAWGYVLAGDYAGLPRDEALALADASIERALALAPDSAEALTIAALVKNDHLEFNEALEFADRALAINPNYALAHHYRGVALGSLGRQDESLAAYLEARKFDPLSPVILSNIAGSYRQQDNLIAAREIAEENLRWNSDKLFANTSLGFLLDESGEYDAAHRLFKDAEAINPADPTPRSYLNDLYLAIDREDLVNWETGRWQDEAFYHFVKGESARAIEIARENTDDPNAAFVLWATEKYPEAKASLRSYIDTIKLLSEDTVIGVDNLYIGVIVADILEKTGDEKAKMLKSKIAKFLDGKSPGDFQSSGLHYICGYWRLMNNDIEGAMAWIETLKGDTSTFLSISNGPQFDPVRERPDFQSFIERKNEEYARHRVAIEAQLADPDPNWINLK